MDRVKEYIHRNQWSERGIVPYRQVRQVHRKKKRDIGNVLEKKHQNRQRAPHHHHHHY